MRLMRLRQRVRSDALFAFSLLLGLLFLFPFVVMVGGSLRDVSVFIADPLVWVPDHPTLANYATILEQSLILRWFANSLVITVVPVATTVLISSAAGYVFAKKRFPGKQILFWVFMAVLMVPSQLTLIPRYLMYSALGWIDTYLAFLVPGMWSVMFMFMMRQFTATIPDSLIDAARIDGCGDGRVFAMVILPLSSAALATVATLAFIAKWNDFMNPLIFTSTESMYNMMVGLASMIQRTGDFGVQMASAVATFLPILLLFVFLQRYFSQGIALSGLKS